MPKRKQVSGRWNTEPQPREHPHSGRPWRTETGGHEFFPASAFRLNSAAWVLAQGSVAEGPCQPIRPSPVSSPTPTPLQGDPGPCVRGHPCHSVSLLLPSFPFVALYTSALSQVPGPHESPYILLVCSVSGAHETSVNLKTRLSCLHEPAPGAGTPSPSGQTTAVA